MNSSFYGLPHRHLSHKPWRLQGNSRETVRGAVRGAAARERLLHPSASKWAQRRTRLRLIQVYIRRFGEDEFALKFKAARLPPRPRANWLPGGYASWRERILEQKPQRTG